MRNVTASPTRLEPAARCLFSTICTVHQFCGPRLAHKPRGPGTIVRLLRTPTCPCLCHTPRDVRWPQKHLRAGVAERRQKACDALCISYPEKNVRFVPSALPTCPAPLHTPLGSSCPCQTHTQEHNRARLPGMAATPTRTKPRTNV